jgi:hypothetical protein
MTRFIRRDPCFVSNLSGLLPDLCPVAVPVQDVVSGHRTGERDERDSSEGEEDECFHGSRHGDGRHAMPGAASRKSGRPD